MHGQKVGAGGTAIAPIEAAATPRDEAVRLGRWRWLAALFLLATLVVVAITKIYVPQIERDAYTGLEIAARLKAQQVESWLDERRSDGRVLASDAEFVQRVADVRRRADPEKEALIRRRLDVITGGYGYSAAYLLDPRGEVLLAPDIKHGISAQTRTLLPKIFASGQVAHSAFYIDVEDGQPGLNFVVPLQRTVGGKRQPVAALVLHAEPHESILSLILAWPSTSPTGETLLVQANGESVVYLTELRHQESAALQFKRPLSDRLLPAAIAIGSGQAGTVRGRDYRGMDVLAAYRPVAGTDWHLVAKLDYDEVMAPLWNLVLWVSLVALAAILAIGLMLRRFWLQQQRLHRLAAKARLMESLRQREARFRAVTETAYDAIITADIDGKIVSWNTSATRMFGFDKAEIIGQPLTRIIPPRFQQAAMAGFQRLMNGDPEGRDRSIAELIGRRKDGSEFLLERSVALWQTEDGRFFTCTLRDIAERKQQEEQTRQLLALNETILNNALVGIVYLKERRIVSCNRRLEEIFHYEPGELLGASTAQLYDSRETYDQIGEVAYQAVGEGRNYSCEVMLRHKDGSVFWGALNGRAIDPAQPHEGSIWIYADISERRRAEQETHKLLQAVEQSPVSILITNRNGVIEYVNPSFTRVSGYTPAEALGRSPDILKSNETPRETYEELWRTILAGKIWHGILHNRCKSGDFVWEQISISPIFSEAGEITHFVAVNEDVTARKRIEQELEEHQTRLEDLVLQRTAELNDALAAARLADQSKDEFLANITHELRTPLSAVIGFSSLARPFASDARQREYLDKVNSAGKTLAGIIDDLLDLSKIVAGRMDFEKRSFSLRQVVARSRSVISYKAQEKGLQLVEQISDEIPDVLLGDSLRVEQILLNLLSNAVKFTETGRVELRVGLLSRDAERVCLNIEVEDTGIGLSDEGIALLFKPFSQADASMTRKFGGTGLGLAICKRLAELMDGGISVTSNEGSGSIFRVRLCFALGEASDLPAAENGHESAQVRYRDARVLVVDDQPFNRDVVEGLLAAVGITPHLAENGEQALDAVALGAETFDLILMDIQMPIMDGLTATRVIRKLEGFAELPIIAMTAHTMAHEREKSLHAGMNDHIGKPFDEAGFYRVLAKWIPRGKQSLATAAAPRPPSANGLPALAGVDTRAGLALLLGDEARYRHWLGDFVTETPAAMKQIRQALAAGTQDAASMAAHTLKGRMGLLGMKALHAIAASLETAIDGGAPASELLLDLERGVAAMCSEIQRGLGAVAPADPAAAPVADELPPGLPPACVMRLIEHLQEGDSDSDMLLIDCLTALKDTPWAPHLRQALVHVGNFDYAAAGRLLGGNRQMQAEES